MAWHRNNYDVCHYLSSLFFLEESSIVFYFFISNFMVGWLRKILGIDFDLYQNEDQKYLKHK